MSQPNDAMEREAESVAASMLSLGAAPGVHDRKAVVPPRLVLRRSTGAMPGGSGVPLGPLSDSGQPLPRTIRDFFEPRLGTNLGAVRIHSDARAAAMSRSVSAEAFTWGANIVFGDGRYAPATSAGQHLLAHELVHVAQQDRAAQGGVVMRRWDAATAECTGQPTTKWIERVVVEQETPQSVTLQWSDRSVEAGTASAGKGHCCVDPTTADATACSVQESRRDGSNCTPITDGNGLVVRHRDLSHRGISFWTEFEPTRAIALHTYSPVDGTPLSHGCVRLNEQTAKTIFCGVRQNQSRVDVRGFARPRCDHPTLQREWMSDFTLAGTDVPDGDPAQARTIREERRALNEAFGRRLTVQELRGFTAADIPRCTSQAARPTAEEQRLTAPVAASGTAAAQLLVQSGFGARGRALITALEAARNQTQAERIVDRHGRQLWQAATARAQATGSDGDDRPLYWARLELTRALRQWQPSFSLAPVGRQQLEQRLETASRGMTTAAFAPRSSDKRILISGFDPFFLTGSGAGRGNPSGAAVLALDGRRLTQGGVSAVVQGVIFPVRFQDFDAGAVEQFFRPFLTGSSPVSMIMTISQGGGAEFEVEEFAGRRRSATAPDNLNAPGGGSGTAPIVPAGLGAGDEFIHTALPAPAIRQSLGRTAPLTDETAVTEIAAGATTPTTRSSGPSTGSTAVEGSGGGYLSNEIFYRTRLLRLDVGASIPVGHLHTPYMDPPQGGLSPASFAAERATIVTTVERILTDLVPTL